MKIIKGLKDYIRNEFGYTFGCFKKMSRTELKHEKGRPMMHFRRICMELAIGSISFYIFYKPKYYLLNALRRLK